MNGVCSDGRDAIVSVFLKSVIYRRSGETRGWMGHRGKHAKWARSYPCGAQLSGPVHGALGGVTGCVHGASLRPHGFARGHTGWRMPGPKDAKYHLSRAQLRTLSAMQRPAWPAQGKSTLDPSPGDRPNAFADGSHRQAPTRPMGVVVEREGHWPPSRQKGKCGKSDTEQRAAGNG
jgi:hypothetical protein